MVCRLAPIGVTGHTSECDMLLVDAKVKSVHIIVLDVRYVRCKEPVRPFTNALFSHIYRKCVSFVGMMEAGI